jgi:hypothetical protein
MTGLGCPGYIFCISYNRLSHANITIVNRIILKLKEVRGSFLGAFAKLRKATTSFVMACPSVRPSSWNNSTTSRRIFIKFDFSVFFETLSRKFNSHTYNIYKEPTWCNLAVCLLVTAIILYMFRTLFASILRST